MLRSVDHSSIKLKKTIHPHGFLDTFFLCKCKKYRLNGRNVRNTDIYLRVNITIGFVSLSVFFFFGISQFRYAAAFTRFRATICQTSAARRRVVAIASRSLSRVRTIYTRRKALRYFLYDGRVHAPSGVSFALFCPGGGRKAASAAQ